MPDTVVRIEEIESEADYVIYSEGCGIVSEHCTEAEARLAFYKEAARKALGEKLPIIYKRREPHWVAVSQIK